jgi:hypothetical protein
VNDYDQASRYAARLDPIGLLRWLLPGLSPTVRFLRWLDTRNLPFPGERDRTGDLVACLDDPDHPGPPWALPVECQVEPDADMFGRLLEYLGALWRQQRPSAERGDRYQLGAAVVNLTGTGTASRDFVLGGADTRVCLQVAECNLASRDAAATLEDIAAGKVARCVLAFIPLMRGGGEAGIIARWQELALQEPEERRRSDYGGLAVVFAELTAGASQWKEALKEWSMRQSQQVQEWRAEGKVQALQEALRGLLEQRFGTLPEALLERIGTTDDLGRLQGAIRQVHDIQSLDQLQL